MASLVKMRMFSLPEVKTLPGVDIQRRTCNFVDISQVLAGKKYLDPKTEATLDRAFILYRALTIMLYNYAQSGHPGGSISAGRQWLTAFLTGQMAYDISSPWRKDADFALQAAGHKAMGWYAFNALLNEAVKQARPDLLPKENEFQLRLEDLLGFRKNPSVVTPLREKFSSRCLDGHPTPETPFTFLATGASGVGDATAAGFILAARDIFRVNPPKGFVFEGEGGMTPGRVEEILQITSRAGLENFILVVDHNDASIDVDALCVRDYYSNVRPEERGLLHRFNVVVADGKDFNQLVAAFDYVREFEGSGKPTMLVFRTEKGEGYGFGTNKSHGAGHKMDAPGYFEAQKIFEETFGIALPKVPEKATPEQIEETFWQSLLTIRQALANDVELREYIAGEVTAAKEKLETKNRERGTAHTPPDLSPIFDSSASNALKIESPPKELVLKPGDSMPLRQALALVFGEINKVSGGAIFIGAADLYGSLAFPTGIPYSPFDASNLDGRSIATGITEDGSSGLMAGISTYGKHIGGYGSYGAFLTAMGWTAARLKAIGDQAAVIKDYVPVILVDGHAGPKTGEDGPTHACPQSLSGLASFPKGSVITLTPWDNREIWPLLLTALRAKPRPSVVVPFVTRPPEMVIDREALGLADPLAAIKGVYHLRPPLQEKEADVWVILQGSAVMHELVVNGGEVMREIEKAGFNIGFAYVSSAELFDRLTEEERRRIWNEQMAQNAMGITDFTGDTMDRWIMSEAGRKATLHPFRNGRFLGSGIGSHVLRQGGLDAEQIKDAVIAFAESRA